MRGRGTLRGHPGRRGLITGTVVSLSNGKLTLLNLNEVITLFSPLSAHCQGEPCQHANACRDQVHKVKQESDPLGLPEDGSGQQVDAPQED